MSEIGIKPETRRTYLRLKEIRSEIKNLERRILDSVHMDNWSIEPRGLRNSVHEMGIGEDLEAVSEKV
ncbi:MAG: hypothetical protein BA873_09575 [Desulfobulbaceae bacterium C00003063]|nr:MAG: hypothetical protein BA873_09575 [Desulfobulbaceae bacterium C00003063]